MASMGLMAFAMGTRINCIPPMEHIIRQELVLTHTQTSFLITIPVIMMASLCIPAGILVDKIGFKKVAGNGAIIMTLGAVLRGLATDYSSLIIFTILLGVGSALVAPSINKFVSLWVPREMAGTTISIYAASTGVGSAISVAITLPLIFPITNTFQGTFLVWSIPTIIAAITWWIFMKEPAHVNLSSQKTVEASIPLREILANKNLWLIAIFSFLIHFFILNWTAWAPALIMGKGAQPDLAALIASLTPWLTIPSMLLAPRLSNKLGLRKPFLWFPSIMLALLSLSAIYSNVFFTLPIMILVGLMQSASMVVIMALPIESMPKIIQYITYAMPLRYYFTIVRGLFLKGVGIVELWYEAVMLLVLSVIIFTLSVLRFNKRIG